MTTYRLANSPADFKACHKLVKAESLKGKLSSPTILAERDGELLGFFATQKNPAAVIAGPMIVREDKRGSGFIMVRLIEAYEKVLWKAGVRKYFITTDPEREKWNESLERMGYVPLEEHEGHLWFERELEAR